MGGASVARSEILGEVVDPGAWVVGLVLGAHSRIAEQSTGLCSYM